MGGLDQPGFTALVRGGCTACGAAVVEIRSFIDRSLVTMLGEPNNDGRWAHDGEKFVDGTYRITCASCAHVVFACEDCPRCNATGGLAPALGDASRLVVPKRCPTCNELELLALALIPAAARHGGGEPPKPVPLVELGDPGYHVVAFACDACEAAVVAERCPLCDAPGPLRPRP
jgi:hypothetical protein